MADQADRSKVPAAGAALAFVGSTFPVPPVLIGTGSAKEVEDGLVAAYLATVRVITAMGFEAGREAIRREYPLVPPGAADDELRRFSAAYEKVSTARVRSAVRRALRLPSTETTVQRLAAETELELRRAEPDRAKLGRLSIQLARARGGEGSREDAVAKVFTAEKSHAKEHVAAQARRALGIARQLDLERVSPEGALWLLDESLETHTPDCVALSGRFWPHEFLRAHHPPLHHGCGCGLYSKRWAVENGYLSADAEPEGWDAFHAALLAHPHEPVRAALEELRSRGVNMMVDEAESLAFRMAHPRDRLGQWVEKLGFPAYRVGGAVRDPLLGKTPKDVDFMLMAHPEEIKKAVEDAGGRAEDLTVRDRLVGVRAHVPGVTPPDGVELAPPRVERSTGPGRHDFEIVPHPAVSGVATAASLPDDWRVDHTTGPDPEGGDFTQHRFELRNAAGNRVADLTVNQFPHASVVDGISTREAYRRKGYATALLRRAERELGPIQHSEWLTGPGFAWATAVGGDRHGDPRDWTTKMEPGHPIHDDALRRDFTVNAMYRHEQTGELVDPLGGSGDAEARILRTTTPESFKEDSLRILRGIRFISQHGLKLEPGTERQMKEHAPHVTALTRGGVSGTARKELDKILMGDHVGDALRVMRDTGVMSSFLPELAPSIGYDQESRYHDLPLDEHIISVVENAAALGAPLEVRLAALFHDSGKPGTAWRGTDGKLHYYALTPENTSSDWVVVPDAKMVDKVGAFGGELDHETLGADIGREALRRLGYPTATVERVGRLIQEHMLPIAKSKKDAKIRKWVARVGPDLVDDVILHRRADFAGKAGGADPEDVASLDRLAGRIRDAPGPTGVSDLAIGGKDLLEIGMKPGPEVGDVLRRLLDMTLTQPSLNNREWLISQARSMTGLREAAAETVAREVTSGKFEVLHPRGGHGKFRQTVSPLGYSLKPTPDADKLIQKAKGGPPAEHHPDLPEHLRGATPGKTISGASLPPRLKALTDQKAATALGFGPGYSVFVPEEGERGGMVAVGVDKKGRVKREYSADFKDGQAIKKHRRVTALAAKLPEATERMKKDAETDDAAAAVLLMRATGLRPGSERDTKADVQAVGATTLRTEHVKTDENGNVRLQFIGKGGKLLSIPVADPDVAGMLTRKVEARGGSPELLTRGQRLFETDERRANDYLKGVAGEEFKVKDLRTALATALAHNAVKRIAEHPATKKEATKLRKQIATEVSAQLGNTPNEALRSYINPDVWNGWPE